MTEYDADVSFIYLGVLDNYSEKEQLKVCKQYIKTNKLPPVGPRVYKPNELTCFQGMIDDLKGNDLVIVARAEVFKEYKGRGASKRFALNLGDVLKKCNCIIDVAAKLDSNSDEWRDHVDRVYNQVGKTRKKKTSAEYSAMAARRKNKGIVRKWRDKEGDDDYNKQATIWSNLAVREDRAILNMHKDLRKLSSNSLRNIFGSRRACGKWLNKQR